MSESSLPDLVAKPANGFTHLARLEQLGIITDTGLRLTEVIPLEQCEALFGLLGHNDTKTTWVIGDLCLYTGKIYGETYAQAAAATGLSDARLSNITSVCHAIPDEDRFPQLTFSHHAEVAYVPRRERQRWLKRSFDNGWSRNELRRARDKDKREKERLENWKVEHAELVESGEDVPEFKEWVEERLLEPEPKYEILPPGGNLDEEHFCQCVKCGMWHLSNLDVEGAPA